MNSESILARLKELKPLLAARYKVKELELFGSFVRGEQQAGSDIDLLVEFEVGADLFDWIGLMLYLEEVLQCPVDVVPKQSLCTELQGLVLHEAVVL